MSDMSRRDAIRQKFRLRPGAGWPGVLALSPPLDIPVRPDHKPYGRLGDLEVRLATSRREIAEAQRLRYQVFYEEMSARPGPLMTMRRRDTDIYDPFCEHLVVTDGGERLASFSHRRRVIGTYRILRQDVAERTLGFYSQGEFDVSALVEKKVNLRFMELGRSCVHKAYRNRRTMELLWHGLWTYVRQHNVDVMIGCASFPGTDLHGHRQALSFLHHHAPAPEDWQCRAHSNLYRSMDLMSADEINAKSALKGMPPLIKAYLRLGAYFGEGAVVDEAFQTTDVLVVLPVANIDPRYFQHFGRPDEVESRVSGSSNQVQ